MPFDLIVGRNASDKKDFGERGLAFLGKSFVTMGNYTSLSNPIYMDIVRSHVVLVSGKRGSGKSYTLGVMAEALGDLGVEESGNIASIIFDTMGIYWTMKYKNAKDEELLGEWGLDSKNVNVKVFAPFGYFQEFKDRGIDVDAEFAIKISELEASDWVSLFELKFTDPVAVLIESVIGQLREDGKGFERLVDYVQAQDARYLLAQIVGDAFEQARGTCRAIALGGYGGDRDRLFAALDDRFQCIGKVGDDVEPQGGVAAVGAEPAGHVADLDAREGADHIAAQAL